nr:immunoglobulin heavy chain junction region [Macaca mulatta]MOW88208.1 immunoglobulin heavy chain junction region [Macaca mulatta]MOW89478.1 immunoglobulin heavy chain junction region [Macaca mulatta]MOW90380.1 immunoglobulin heavy chain junction region [Macaca mulatta]MOW92169.1 immunoglobulin heavy chain junction region [Macaca mulatta]
CTRPLGPTYYYANSYSDAFDFW